MYNLGNNTQLCIFAQNFKNLKHMKLFYSVLIFVFAYAASFGQLMYTIDDQTVTEAGSGSLSSNKHIPYSFINTSMYNDTYEISEKNGIISATIKKYQNSDNWDFIRYSFLNWQGSAGFYFMYDINGDPQDHKTAYGYVVDFSNSENRYLTFEVQADSEVHLLANLLDIVGRSSNTISPSITIEATVGGVDTTNNSKWKTITMAWTIDANADSYVTEISDTWSCCYYNTNFGRTQSSPIEPLVLDKIAGFELALDYGIHYNMYDYDKHVYFRNIRLGKGEPDLSNIQPISPIALTINNNEKNFDILDYYEGSTPQSYSAVLQNGTHAQVVLNGSEVAISSLQNCNNYKDTLTISVVNSKTTVETKVPIEFSTTPIQAPTLGIVTIDTLGTYLMLAWERPLTQTIEKYSIYREGLTNQYTKLAEQPYNQLSVYVDNTASFNTRAYKYAITATDICGNESPKSIAHKSIHLQKKYENNELQLTWTLYEGAEVLGYQLLEGTTHMNMVAIDEFATDQTSYTVDNPGTKLYRIGTIMKEEITPEVLKIESGPFTLAMSNIAEATTEIELTTSSITYLVNDHTIEIESTQALSNASVALFTSNGQLLESTVCNSKQCSLSRTAINAGVYVLTISTSQKTVTIPVIIK